MLGKKILYLSRDDVEKVNLGMDVIISLNLGLALEDITTAPLVFQKAQEMGLGTNLKL